MSITDQDRAGAQDVYYLPAGMDPEDIEKTQEDLDFDAFKSEMLDSDQYAKLTVSKQPVDSRMRPMGKKLMQCFECGIDDYTFSQLCTRIREDHGTGLYKVQGRNAKGHFKFGRTIGIEAPKNMTPNSENDVGALIDKFSDAMERQQVRTEEMLRSMMPAQTSGDAIDQIVKITTAVAPILTALGISRPEPPPPQKTLVEMLTEVKMVQELMGGNNDGLQGEANGWSALTATLQSLGPAIGAALAAAPPTPEAAPQLAAPKLEPETTALETTPSHDQMLEHQKAVEMQKEALTKQIGMLLIQAKGGADPAAIAEMVVNMTPAEHEERLWNTILPENCVDTMAAAVPEVNEHREWFDNLRIGILDLMSEPEPSAEDLAEDAAIDAAQKSEAENLQSDENGDNLATSDAVAGAENDTDAPDGDSTGNT